MATYIIQDNYTGYIWGDTRDYNGAVYNASDPIDACRALDEILKSGPRGYEETRTPAENGYTVYRVDVNGSEAVGVVHDGQDQEYIEAVMRDCPVVAYVGVRDHE